MPTGRDPLASHLDSDPVIQLQRQHSSSTAGSLADDPRSLVGPSELFVPTLASGVVQGNAQAAVRVKELSLIAFEVVAKTTGEPKILFLVRAAESRGNDMIYLEPAQHQCLRAQTVATAVAGLTTNTLFHFI